VAVRGEEQDPLEAVDDPGEGMSAVTVAQRLGRGAHPREVGRAALLEGPDRLLAGGEAAPRPDSLGGFSLLRAIAQERAHVVVLLSDLAPLLLGRLLAGAAREEALERQLGRADVLHALRDGPPPLLRATRPLLAGDALDRGEQSASGSLQLGDGRFPLLCGDRPHAALPRQDIARRGR